MGIPFSFVFFLVYALLMLTFLYDKSQSNIYIVNGFRISANVLLRILSIDFFFIIYSVYLILLICLRESLGPHVFTLFIKFYYIYHNG